MAFAPGRRPSPHARPEKERKRMLDLRREGHFRYDLREILLRSSFPPEQIASFGATIISKGSRVSAAAAKEFVAQKLEAQLLTKGERDAIVALIDRYSRWR